jgi:recombination protein RecA
MARKSAKSQKLETAVARIQARFGSRSLTRGRPPPGEMLPAGRSPVVPHIPTGFPELDAALGIGGLPKGAICEIVGLPTSGKTTLALKFLAQAQAGGGQGLSCRQVAYVDQARYLDGEYAHRCGVNLSHLLVGTPYGLDETLATTEALVRSESLAALVFDAMDDLVSDSHAAPQLAACFHRLSAPLSRSGTVLLFLHASSEAPASVAVAHHAAVRLQVVRERWLDRHGDIRGYEARVEVLKNRFGPSGRAVTLTIEFNGTVHGNGL